MKNNFVYIIIGLLVVIILGLSVGFVNLYNRVEYLEARTNEQIEISNKQSKDIWEVNSELNNLDLYWEIEEVK